MPKYIVGVREVWVQPVEIEADSDSEAKHRVWRGEGNRIDSEFEYSHCLDSSLWTVEEVKEDIHDTEGGDKQ